MRAHSKELQILSLLCVFLVDAEARQEAVVMKNLGPTVELLLLGIVCSVTLLATLQICSAIEHRCTANISHKSPPRLLIIVLLSLMLLASTSSKEWLFIIVIRGVNVEVKAEIRWPGWLLHGHWHSSLVLE